MDLQRRLAASQARTRAIEQYLDTSSVCKLQLGAGNHALAGWFNTDLQPVPPEIYYLDSTASFPFADASFDYVFSEHHLEHVSWARAQPMLAECFRVLTPGGRIRIATPSLEALVGLISGQPDDLGRRYVDFMSSRFLQPDLPAGPAGVLNNAFVSWGHQFLYDRPTLRADLARAGFVELVETVPGQSADPHLRGIEGHGDFIGDEAMNQFETMVIEASKPLEIGPT